MKFVCDNCSTQYLISDDKVGPTGVKVRCKRCGDVIVVRPGSSGASDPGEGNGEDTVSDGSPFAPEGGAGEGDEVGQAFDQLLRGGLGEDEADENESDGQATEVFDVGALQEQRRGTGDRDKIDEVFASAESTELQRDPTDPGQHHADWYVAIGDEQVGPMGLPEIETRWSEAEIGLQTLAWHPGMGDWKTIAEIPELSHLSKRKSEPFRETTDVAAPDEGPVAASGGSQPPVDPGEEWAPYKGSALSSLVEEEIALAESSPPPEEEDSEDLAPLDDGSPAEEGEVPPWEMDEPKSGQVAQPSDSFFDSSLDQKSDDDAGYFDGSYSRSGRVLAGPAYLGNSRKKSGSSKWILIGALGVLVLGGGTVAAIMLTGEENTQPTKTDPAGLGTDPGKGSASDPVNKGQDDPKGPKDGPNANAVDGGSRAGGASDGKTKEDPGKPDGGDKKGASEGADAGEQKHIVVAKPTKGQPKGDRPKATTPGTKKRKKRKRTDSAGTTKPPKPPPSDKTNVAEADPSLPKKLSKEQISQTMRKYIGAMKSCVEQQKQRDPSVTGTMKVSFVINPSGKVNGITVKTSEHKGTYVAGCISFIIKSMKFPKAQQPFTVPVLPLKLGG